ncbi:hypothetical protein ACW5EG_15665 [Luteimonas sp. A611]
MTQSERKPELTFKSLDALIEAMPAGPVSVLSSPQWAKPLTAVGTVGTFLGLLPSLLLQWLEPAFWMVTLARLGVITALIGFAPGFARNLWVLFNQFRHQRRGFIEQFDNDAAQLLALAGRLAAYPRGVLERQRRYAVMGQTRLNSRLVMMLGGVERLGLLPLMLSILVLLRNWQDLLAVPFWLAILALMAVMLWIIGWFAAEFRRRLQLYEFLLDEALQIKNGEQRETGVRVDFLTSPGQNATLECPGTSDT